MDEGGRGGGRGCGKYGEKDGMDVVKERSGGEVLEKRRLGR